ncbi:type II toxin-antitoxin system RelE/ParE family toxin [Patescibacteria group bacterium]
MDEIEKLLQKATTNDRLRLLSVMEQLHSKELRNLQIKKIRGMNLYRVRVGRYRITFVIDIKTKDIEIKAVRLRNEKTYKKL